MLQASPFRALISFASCALGALAFVCASPSSNAQCPELGPVQNYTGAGTTTCPCFVQNEEAGAIFNNIPAAQFPIQITKIGIGWGSQFGSAPASVEDSINIYPAGLPNPGSPLYSFGAPQMLDGFINEFDVEPLGPITVNAEPFTVTLRFYNPNNQDPSLPSIVHDGNGCQAGKNVVLAQGIGWTNSCSLGVSGDWVVYVKYRANCGGGGGSVGTAYCFGDGSGAACPCDPGQAGGPGEGCANSFGTGGKLSGTGQAKVSNDTLVLHVQGLPPTASGLYFQGTFKQNGGLGSLSGDGLLCANGSIIRLGAKFSSGGQSDFGFGIGSDPLISVKGLIPAAGATREYQVWYRNSANFCTASPSNFSNGLEITWAP